MTCVRCRKPITGGNAIMSNKGQIDTVNHYGLEKFSECANLIARTDIKVQFSFDRDDRRADMCRHCFGVVVREMCEAGRI